MMYFAGVVASYIRRIAFPVIILSFVLLFPQKTIAGESLPDLRISYPSLSASEVYFTIVNSTAGPVRRNNDGTGPRLKVRFQWLRENQTEIGSPHDVDIDYYVFVLDDPFNEGTRQYLFDARLGGGFWFGYVFEWLTNPTTSPSDAKILKITVDPENAVTESNEDNNSKMMRRRLPDLRPTSITFNKDHLAFKIRNNPNNHFVSPDGFAVQFMWLDHEDEPVGPIYVWRDDSAIIHVPNSREDKLIGDGTFIFDTTRTLPHPSTREAGFSADYHTQFSMEPVQVFLTTNIPATARTLRVTIDYEQDIAETNDKDDVFDVERPLPDLRVASGGRFYETTEGFVKKVLEFKPINVGNNDVNYPDDHRMKLSLTWMRDITTPIGDPYVFDSMPARYIQPLGVDTFGYWRFDSTYFREIETWLNEPPTGANQLKVSLDSEDIVVEKREDNNLAYYRVPQSQAAYSYITAPSPTAVNATPSPTLIISHPEVISVLNSPTPTPIIAVKYAPFLKIFKNVKGVATAGPETTSWFDSIIRWLQSLFYRPPSQLYPTPSVSSPTVWPTQPPIPTITSSQPSASQIIIEAFQTRRFDGLESIMLDTVGYGIFATECCGPLPRAETLAYVQRYVTDRVTPRTWNFDQTDPTIARIRGVLTGENEFIVLASDNSCLVFRFDIIGRISSVFKYNNCLDATNP